MQFAQEDLVLFKAAAQKEFARKKNMSWGERRVTTTKEDTERRVHRNTECRSPNVYSVDLANSAPYPLSSCPIQK